MSVSVLNGLQSTMQTQYLELQLICVDGVVNRKIGAFTTEEGHRRHDGCKLVKLLQELVTLE